MSKSFKERPSDEEGIKRQPRFVRTEFTLGSRKQAHNTPDESKRPKGLVEFDKIRIPPLILNGKNITSGQQAVAARSGIRIEVKRIQRDLTAFDNEQNNPMRKRLLERREALEASIRKATAFLNQWTNLDHSWYLRQLINTGDPLTSKAQQLLQLRDLQRKQSLTPEQEGIKDTLSRSLRDTLMGRIREKQRGK